MKDTKKIDDDVYRIYARDLYGFLRIELPRQLVERAKVVDETDIDIAGFTPNEFKHCIDEKYIARLPDQGPGTKNLYLYVDGNRVEIGRPDYDGRNMVYGPVKNGLFESGRSTFEYIFVSQTVPEYFDGSMHEPNTRFDADVVKQVLVRDEDEALFEKIRETKMKDQYSMAEDNGYAVCRQCDTVFENQSALNGHQPHCNNGGGSE